MIIVADDLSGAAECAGVAWRFGHHVTLFCGSVEASAEGTVVVDTDSRLLGPRAAARRVSASLAGSSARPPDLFKKIDSVLRGQVRAELWAIADLYEHERTLLVPANPTLGRTLEGGLMKVRGVPLHLTEFARDPHYGALSSDPIRLLGTSVRRPTRCVSLGDPLPSRGILVGQVGCEADLDRWGEVAVAGGLAASGSAAFLAAILRALGHRERSCTSAPLTPSPATLVVSGSASEASRAYIQQARDGGVPTVALDAVAASRGGYRDAAGELIRIMTSGASAILHVAGPIVAGKGAGDRITRALASIAEDLVSQGLVERLLLEGGATASAVLAALSMRRFEVTRECSPGVVLLSSPDRPGLEVATKPGSYPWMAPFSIRS